MAIRNHGGLKTRIMHVLKQFKEFFDGCSTWQNMSTVKLHRPTLFYQLKRPKQA